MSEVNIREILDEFLKKTDVLVKEVMAHGIDYGGVKLLFEFVIRGMEHVEEMEDYLSTIEEEHSPKADLRTKCDKNTTR